MNVKAVLLVYVLQLIAGVIWYSAAPAEVAQQLEGGSLSDGFNGSMIGFAIALFVYTYFTAWLLVKANIGSSFGMMLIVIMSWLFVVLPNFFFTSLFLDFSHMGYLLSFGLISCLIAAFILPFWRASRTIFKG